MCKFSKQIIKNIMKLSKLKTKNQSALNTVKGLEEFAKNIKKKKRELRENEERFIIRKITFLLFVLNENISKKDYMLLLETLDLVVTKQDTEDIHIQNDFVLPSLESKEKSDAEEIEKESKGIDLGLVDKLEENLKNKIFFQDHAIEAIVKKVKLSVSGLLEENKPIGSFIFSGPTGVGKTELAKELANNLDLAFVRLDMSEYANEEFGRAKLIGSAPGFKGFESGGSLTNAILDNPSCVLLLDEIEKASSDLMSIFLQILDNAELTDAHGVKVSFSNVIIIMTSNLGVQTQAVAGFANQTKSVDTSAIKEYFAPEFLNRLDGVLMFSHLSRDVAINIVDKFIMDTAATLTKQNIAIKMSDLAKEKLSNIGFDEAMGARAMNRAVTSNIKIPISEEIISGNLKHGGSVFVDVKNDEFSFHYEYEAKIPEV